MTNKKSLQESQKNRDAVLESYLSAEAQCSLKYNNGGKVSEEALMELISSMAEVNDASKEVNEKMRQAGLVPACDCPDSKEAARNGWHNNLASV